VPLNISRPKTDEGTGNSGRLHDGELYELTGTGGDLL
jgi:hypothetical protein